MSEPRYIVKDDGTQHRPWCVIDTANKALAECFEDRMQAEEYAKEMNASEADGYPSGTVDDEQSYPTQYGPWRGEKPLACITKTTESYEACTLVADECQSNLEFEGNHTCVRLDDARDGGVDFDFIHECGRRFRVTVTEVEA